MAISNRHPKISDFVLTPSASDRFAVVRLRRRRTDVRTDVRTDTRYKINRVSKVIFASNFTKIAVSVTITFP